MRSKLMTQVLCVLVLFVLAGSLAAQTNTGQVSGTVTDKSGAVISGAKVTFTNINTGNEYTAESNAAGAFVRSDLPVGIYEMKVAASGFGDYRVQQVNVHVSDRLTIDPVLGVAGAAETVDVTTTAVQAQSTQMVQGLINQTQVLELPLNNRNFVQLATLVPGVSSSLADEVGLGLTSTVSISINGARRNAVNWNVDGASNVDVGSNITLLSTPTIDSISEFKILTSTYSAEYGRSGGGVVNIVTKGGGKSFHGNVYEFLRNDYMNANTFFNKFNRVVPLVRPRLRYNNFGYTFGGPVTIPGLYNEERKKTFFFWSQEWRRVSRASSNSSPIVPSVAFRAGNFSTVTPAPIDPLTGTAFPGGIIPQARWHPSARALVDGTYWPLPTTGLTGFTFTAPNINNTRQEAIRVDHNFTENWRLMGRYTHDQSETQEPGGLFNGIVIPNRATTRTIVPGQVLVVQLTGVLGPRWTNDFQANISGNKIDSTLIGQGRRSDWPGFTAPEVFPGNLGDIMPSIAITGFSSVNIIPEFHNVYWTAGFKNTTSWLVNNHYFRFGGEIAWDRKTENSQNAVNGTFSFNGSRTAPNPCAAPCSQANYAFADFLLGLTSTTGGYTEADTIIRNHLRFGRYEFFAQDDWKVHPRLTLNLGVRYMYTPPVIDRDNQLASWNPANYTLANAPTCANAACTLLTTGTGSPLNGVVIAGVNSPFGRAIYDNDWNNFMPRLGFAWDMFSDSRTIMRGGWGLYYDQPLVGIFLQNTQVSPAYTNQPSWVSGSFSDPDGTAVAGTRALPSLIIATEPNFVNPQTQHWNFGIQHEFAKNVLFELGYVGSKGSNLIRINDINFPQPDAVVATGGTGSPNLVRPFRGYTTIRWHDTKGENKYHGLISNLRMENIKGFLLNAAYTWSKNMTDVTNDRDALDIPQNPLRQDLEYAVARSDRTHILSTSYVWHMPFFRSSENAFLKHVIGGWELSGITAIQSGLPVPRILATSTNNFRNGNRVSYTGIDPRSNLPSNIYMWNPAAFTDPALGTYGNTPKSPLRYPRNNQTDLSISKNWQLWSEASRFQLRLDTFNVFNHTQFNLANAQRSTAAGNTFGQFTGARAPRELQVGAKFYF